MRDIDFLGEIVRYMFYRKRLSGRKIEANRYKNMDGIGKFVVFVMIFLCVLSKNRRNFLKKVEKERKKERRGDNV